MLGIANEHIEVAACQALLQQSLEILILLGTGVLELINHEMGDGGPYTLIDECRAALQYGADEFVGVTDEDGVGLMAETFQMQVNHAQQTQQQEAEEGKKKDQI